MFKSHGSPKSMELLDCNINRLLIYTKPYGGTHQVSPFLPLFPISAPLPMIIPC